MKLKLKNLIMAVSFLLIGSFEYLNASEKSTITPQYNDDDQLTGYLFANSLNFEDVQYHIKIISDYILELSSDFNKDSKDGKQIYLLSKEFYKNKGKNVIIKGQQPQTVSQLTKVQDVFKKLAERIKNQLNEGNFDINKIQFLRDSRLIRFWGDVLKKTGINDLVYTKSLKLCQTLADKIMEDNNFNLEEKKQMILLLHSLQRNIPDASQHQNIKTVEAEYTKAIKRLLELEDYLNNNLVKNINLRTKTIKKWNEKNPASKKYVLGGWFVVQGWLPFKSTAEDRMIKFTDEVRGYGENIKNELHTKFFGTENFKNETMKYYLVVSDHQSEKNRRVSLETIMNTIYNAYNNLVTEWQEYLKDAFPGETVNLFGRKYNNCYLSSNKEGKALLDLKNNYFINQDEQQKASLHNQVSYFKRQVSKMEYTDLENKFDELAKKIETMIFTKEIKNNTLVGTQEIESIQPE